ncbi:MAG TPA: RnfABCDGE type electron transport complex subunit D, partial [Elusimicrobiota bacterium]|nr:RnfABCDGE type electron transport complex subunit D [Elusimicrobiota bacterium]
WLQIACLICYSVATRSIFHIERSNWVIAFDVAWGMLLDAAIGRFRYGSVRFPLSAWVIGLTATVMIDSRYPLVYFVAVTAAILSKTLFTCRGKHYLNPGNFGAVVIFQFAVGYALSTQRIYSGYVWPTVVVFVMGLANVIYARKATLCLSFLASFLLCAWVRTKLGGVHYVMAMGPALSPSFLIFTFHMLSDPATTPKSVKGDLVFAFVVALLDAFFRMATVPFGIFYSLFLTSCMMPVYRGWRDGQETASARAGSLSSLSPV